MMYPNKFLKPKPKPEKKQKCEIVIEKTAKGIRKKIIGECSPAQLKALEGQRDLD